MTTAPPERASRVVAESDDDFAATVGGAAHHFAQYCRGFVDRFVDVAAVSTFADQEIALRDRFRIAQDWQIATTDVARKS